MPSAKTEAQPWKPPYDKDALLSPTGPIDPILVQDAIRTLMLVMPVYPDEHKQFTDRRKYAAIEQVKSLYPRDAIELSLAVQAVAAHYASAAAMRLGMNEAPPAGQGSRHLSAAATQSRVMDSMLKALERRQAKPVELPTLPHDWGYTDPSATIDTLEAEAAAVLGDTGESDGIIWDEAALEAATMEIGPDAYDDTPLTPVEGVRPDGSIIVPEDPTPEQKDYIGRRIFQNMRGDYIAHIKNGDMHKLRIPRIRPGDLIP